MQVASRLISKPLPLFKIKIIYQRIQELIASRMRDVSRANTTNKKEKEKEKEKKE